jgi:hypothetical protein
MTPGRRIGVGHLPAGLGRRQAGRGDRGRIPIAASPRVYDLRHACLSTWLNGRCARHRWLSGLDTASRSFSRFAPNPLTVRMRSPGGASTKRSAIKMTAVISDREPGCVLGAPSRIALHPVAQDRNHAHQESESFPSSRGMVTGQIDWSGAGPNRRPSASQATARAAVTRNFLTWSANVGAYRASRSAPPAVPDR